MATKYERKHKLTPEEKQRKRVEILLDGKDKDQGVIERILQYLKEGLRSLEILNILFVEDETMNQMRFLQLLEKAYIIAENDIHKDREYIFQLHMERYEKLYEKAIIMEDFWGRPLEKKKDWPVMRARYGNAVKALRSKEKLLGLHDKSFTIEVNDDQKVSLIDEREKTGIPAGINIDNLTLDEQVELLSLIKEARTVPIEGIQRVVVKQTVIEINTTTGGRQKKTLQEIQDVIYEDIPLDVVSKFVDTKKDEVEEVLAVGVEIKDHVDRTVKRRSVEGIKEQINTNLLDAFKEKLKRK